MTQSRLMRLLYRLFPPLTKPSDFGIIPWYRDPRVWAAFSSISLFTTFLTLYIRPQDDEKTFKLFLGLHSPILFVDLVTLFMVTIKYPFLSDTISTIDGENVFVPFHKTKSLNLIALFVYLGKLVFILWHAPLLLIFSQTSAFRALMVVSGYVSYFYNTIWGAKIFYQTYYSYDQWDQVNVPSQWKVLTTHTTTQTLPNNIAFFSAVKSRIYGGGTIQAFPPQDNDDDLDHVGLLSKSASFINTKNTNSTYNNFPQHEDYSPMPDCGVSDIYLDPTIHSPDLSQTGSDVYDIEVPIQALDIPSLIHIAGFPTVEPSTSTASSDVASTGSDQGLYSPPVITSPGSDDLP